CEWYRSRARHGTSATGKTRRKAILRSSGETPGGNDTRPSPVRVVAKTGVQSAGNDALRELALRLRVRGRVPSAWAVSAFIPRRHGHRKKVVVGLGRRRCPSGGAHRLRLRAAGQGLGRGAARLAA